MLSDTAICGKEPRFDGTPKASRGVGHVEAPRGTLIHDYASDENGLIENYLANIQGKFMLSINDQTKNLSPT